MSKLIGTEPNQIPTNQLLGTGAYATIANYLPLTGGTMQGGLNFNNFNIWGVNNLGFSDPGPYEGIEWAGGNIWRIFESPNDLTTNGGGNLQIVQNSTRRATFNTSGQLELPVAVGTAPLVVTSTTRVANLNVATAGVADNVSGTVAIANGGTGATTTTVARSNLGVPGLATTNTFTQIQTFDQDIISNGRIKLKELDYINAYTQRFAQSYVPNAYLTSGEWQPICTVTPNGSSQNYYLTGKIYVQTGANTQIIDFQVGIRSNTLPDLSWTLNYSEQLLGEFTFVKPVLWVKETDPASVQLALEHVSNSIHNISVDLDVINRGNYNNIVMNTAVTSEVTSIPAGYTQYEFTKSLTLNQQQFTYISGPLAPTAAVDTNTTQLATTAFVVGQAASTNPAMNGTVATGTSLRYARADHVHPVDTSRAPLAGSTSITTLGTITTGTWNAGWVTSSGQIAAAQGVKHGLIGHPVYETAVEYGADAAGTWRKIISIQLGAGTYSTHGFCVEVLDCQGNHAFQGTHNTVSSERYNVACVRTNDTVLNTPDQCFITGPGNLIRAVKLGVGNYEIQLQNSQQYREYRIRVYSYATNQSHTITYLTGAEAGATGTAQYAPTIATGTTDKFQRVTATSYNGLGFTANATGFQVVGGTTSKTLTVNNTLTLSGTDGSTLNIGSGGTLGTGAYATIANYAALGSANTFTGTNNFNLGLGGSSATGRFALALDGGGNLNLGRVDNTSSTPYIDFNSGSTTVDFDARIQATGGSGVSGNGTLTYTAGFHNFGGRVGVGSAPSNQRLLVSGTLTGSTDQRASEINVTVGSTVTAQAIGVLSVASTQAASFTLPNLYHFLAYQGTLGAGSTVTNQYGFYVSSVLTGATNNFGFRGDIASGTGRWNFYAAGTAENYFAGKTTIAGQLVASGGLNISANLTIANQAGTSGQVLTSQGSGLAPVWASSLSNAKAYFYAGF